MRLLVNELVEESEFELKLQLPTVISYAAVIYVSCFASEVVDVNLDGCHDRSLEDCGRGGGGGVPARGVGEQTSM